jgi:hypothetical protein
LFGDGPVDKRPIVHSRRPQLDPEPHVEDDAVAAAPVPEEDELVGMGLVVGTAQAATDAETKPLQVRENALDTWRQRVRRHGSDRLRQAPAAV